MTYLKILLVVLLTTWTVPAHAESSIEDLINTITKRLSGAFGDRDLWVTRWEF